MACSSWKEPSPRLFENWTNSDREGSWLQQSQPSEIQDHHQRRCNTRNVCQMCVQLNQKLNDTFKKLKSHRVHHCSGFLATSESHLQTSTLKTLEITLVFDIWIQSNSLEQNKTPPLSPCTQKLSYLHQQSSHRFI